MIWYRDGIVWVPAPAALAQQRAGLRVGALTLKVDGVAPSLRQTIEFHLLVEGQRLGPLRGEVVRVEGDEIALHLADDARDALVRLLPPGATTTGAALSADEASSEAVVTQSWRAGRAGELIGKLAGRMTLGVVPRLFDEVPVESLSPVTTLGRLLSFLQQQRRSGLLTVEGVAYTKQVSFIDGVAVNITVSPVKEDEQIGQLLLGAHWITPHKLADVLRWARQNKTPVGSALIQSGVLDDARLNRALVHQTYRRLRDLFGWQGAIFRFDSGAKATMGSHPMSVPRLFHELAQELLREALLDDLLVLLSPFVERFPRIEGGDTDRLRRLVPDDKGRQVCQRLFCGDRTLRQAITASVLGRPRTVQLVLYLLAARLLVLDVEPAAAGTVPPESLVRERVRALGVQDSFQRLGISYWAHPSEISPAHRRRLAHYAPGSDMSRADAGAAAKACKLLDEAALTIGTRAARRHFRERLLQPDQLRFLVQFVTDERDHLRIEQRDDEARRLDEVLADLG